MSRRPARITKAEVRRILEGAKAAGVTLTVQVDRDGIIQFVADGDKSKPEPTLKPGLVL